MIFEIESVPNKLKKIGFFFNDEFRKRLKFLSIFLLNSADANFLKSVSGFQLINSTEGTSSGTFAPESQQCFACPSGKYIVDPNSDSCTTCPKGKIFILE
jgi:hypothetical protein